MKSNFKSPAIWVLSVSLTISISTLIALFVENGLSDDVLFILLAVLRYSSFLLFVSSVYLTISGFKHVFSKPSVRSVLSLVFTFCLALYGLGIIIIDAFILTITGGKE